MATAKLFSPMEAGFANTSSIKQQVLQSLQTGEEYRHAFIEEAVRTRITAQIKTIREQRKWDYKQLADKIDKKVSWAYRLEDPNMAPPTIPTLLQVAAAFDVGLDVRFCPFSEFLDDVTSLTPESFAVPSFDDELKSGSFLKSRHRIRVHRCSKRRPRRKSISAETGQAKYDCHNKIIGIYRASRPDLAALAS
jgi:transcriptional regulator with XRE-family HTH domain